MKEKDLARHLLGLKAERIELEKIKAVALRKTDAERQIMLKNQARSLAFKKRILDAIMSRKAREFAKKLAALKSQAEIHKHERVAQEGALKKEESVFLEEKHEKFALIEEEHNNLSRERKALENKFNLLQQHERAELKNHKAMLSRQLGMHIQSNDILFKDKVERFKKDMHEELRRKTENILEKNAMSVNSEVKRREFSLREQLEREYEDKLKHELTKREIEMQRKKELLEKHVMEHLKKALE